MFEVFAGMCFYGAAMLKQCDDYVVESYDDPMTCEIVAVDYQRQGRWINPACLPSESVEPMPEGEPVGDDPARPVCSFFVDNLNAASLIQMYAEISAEK